MADDTKKDDESTEEVLASIKRILSEDGLEASSSDRGQLKGTVSGATQSAVVKELRRLVEEYADLPEDLVQAVSELELVTLADDLDLPDGSLIELTEIKRERDSDISGGSESSILSSTVMNEFLEKVADDLGLGSADENSCTGDLDNMLSLHFKIAAYRWMEKNLESLVRNLVRDEIERLAKDL